MNALFTIARLELISAARLNWVRLLTAAFAILSLAAAYAAGAANEIAGVDGFARTTMTLVPVVLILVPLAALILGISGQASEPGSEPFLFGQPVARATVVCGRWLGQAAALAGAVVVGFGIGGAAIAAAAGPAGVGRYAAFVAAAVALGSIFLAIAAALAASVGRRAAALGAGTFAWFFFVLFYDAAALSAAVWIGGARGGRFLFASIFGNPADVVRVAMLSLAGLPNVLGAAGDAWVRFLGGPVTATLAAAVSLVIWTAAPLAVAAKMIARRDL